MKKTASADAPRQQGRVKIIPWDVIKANEAARPIDLTGEENDDIFSLNEAEQQELPKLALPEPLSQKLFDHQRYGVNWMYNLFNNNEKGAILADDMGLGKTLQVTSFLTGTMMEEKIFTSLVLTPKSVIPGWERELNNNLKSHLTNVNITVIDAGMKKKQRSNLLSQIEESRQSAKYVIIMSHHLLLTMIEEVGRINWDCVVLDEGHIIKNTTTKMSQTMHQLKSPFRLLLSGTPIQNDLREFWALVNWATQGSRFGREIEFRKTFAEPILRGQDPGAGEKTRSLAAEARISLVRATRPILLRRKKADQRQKELQLPEKKELVVWIRLSSKQRQQYYEYVHSTRFEEAMRQSTYPVEVINTLKTICRHPILLKDAQQSRDVDELDSAMQRMGLEDADGQQEATTNYAKGHFFDILGRTPTKDELLAESTKLRVLARMTNRLVKADHRVLIFSQSKRMLDIIQFMFVEYGFATFKIDGSTPSDERQYIIDEFNTPGEEYSGPKICLLTTKACGVGINLIGADRVIIFDPSWNPAEDSQAVDRAYRIGQTKPVIVYRLIHSSCVEEKVYQKQVFKEGLRVISEKGNETKRYFSEKSQLRELLSLGGKDAVEILKQVPNKMDLLQLDNLFGMDSVIGCTRHDRLYKDDQPEASSITEQEKFPEVKERKAIDNTCDDKKVVNQQEDEEEDAEFDGPASCVKKCNVQQNQAVCASTIVDLTQEDDDDEEEVVQVVKNHNRKKKIVIDEEEDEEKQDTTEYSSSPENNSELTSEKEAYSEVLNDAFFKMSLTENQEEIDLDEVEAVVDANCEPISENGVIENNEYDGGHSMPSDNMTVEIRLKVSDIFANLDEIPDGEDPTISEETECDVSEERVEQGNDEVCEVDLDDDSTSFSPTLPVVEECFEEKELISAEMSNDTELEIESLEAIGLETSVAAAAAAAVLLLEENDTIEMDNELLRDEENYIQGNDLLEQSNEVQDEQVIFEQDPDDHTVRLEDQGHSENNAADGQHHHSEAQIKDPYDDDYSEGNDSCDEMDDDEEFNLTLSHTVSSQQFYSTVSRNTAEDNNRNMGDVMIGSNQFVPLMSMKELRELQRQTCQPNQGFQDTQIEHLSQTSNGNAPDNEVDTTTHHDKDDIVLSSQESVAPSLKPSTILHQYCNLSLFSPSASSESSVVLDMLALDHLSNCSDSRRNSTASVVAVDTAPTLPIVDTLTNKEPSAIEDTTPKANKIPTHKLFFRNSLCDKKRQLLYQQLAHPSNTNTMEDTTTTATNSEERERIPLTPIRNPDNHGNTMRPFPTSGYLSRIKIMGSSVKKDTMTFDGTSRKVSATPTVQRGFVDYSYMDDSSCDENSVILVSPAFAHKVPDNVKSLRSSHTSSRDRAQSLDTSIELASELARIVEATHDHAEEEEQRRYDEEYAETTSSVTDIIDRLASLKVQDLVQQKNQLSLFDVEDKKQKSMKVEKVLFFDS